MGLEKEWEGRGTGEAGVDAGFLGCFPKEHVTKLKGEGMIFRCQLALYLLFFSFVQYVVPTALTLTNSQPISSSNPNLALRLTTILGDVVEGVTPKVKSLEDPDGEVNPRTRAMTPGEDK